ncbi:NAD(P)H-binding protein [Streptomyces flaveolus]|uniref:NAD(P)H-binding protein n=1 Tax=Streptomyces flaveolus TaxID=67297 RepID=UPI00341B10C7
MDPPPAIRGRAGPRRPLQQAAHDATPHSQALRANRGDSGCCQRLAPVAGAVAGAVVGRSDLNWLILRPSLLVDDPGIGTVSLGPAEFRGQIAREDVAATLAELLHEPRIGRQILELNTGSTPIQGAVRANVRS